MTPRRPPAGRGKAGKRLRGKERVVVRYRSKQMSARVVLRLGKTVRVSAKR